MIPPAAGRRGGGLLAPLLLLVGLLDARRRMEEAPSFGQAAGARDVRRGTRDCTAAWGRAGMRRLRAGAGGGRCSFREHERPTHTTPRAGENRTLASGCALTSRSPRQDIPEDITDPRSAAR